MSDRNSSSFFESLNSLCVNLKFDRFVTLLKGSFIYSKTCFENFPRSNITCVIWLSAERIWSRPHLSWRPLMRVLVQYVGWCYRFDVC